MKQIKPDGTVEKRNCDIHGRYNSMATKLINTWVFSECPGCAHDRSKQEKKASEMVARDKRLKFLKDAGVVRRYWGITLDDIAPVSKEQKKPLEIAKQFVENFDTVGREGKCIVFCGGIGTGKTLIASAIIQSLQLGRYIRAIDISRLVRATYNHPGESESTAIQSLVDPDILVIDEAGIQMDSEHESVLITDLIDRRYGDMKSTIICSNLPAGELEKIFGERAWSRIMQNSIIAPVVGESNREAVPATLKRMDIDAWTR